MRNIIFLQSVISCICISYCTTHFRSNWRQSSTTDLFTNTGRRPSFTNNRIGSMFRSPRQSHTRFRGNMFTKHLPNIIQSGDIRRKHPLTSRHSIDTHNRILEIQTRIHNIRGGNVLEPLRVLARVLKNVKSRLITRQNRNNRQPSVQHIVDTLARTPTNLGKVARGILIEEAKLKQVNAVWPECTLDDFKSLDTSTIFREDMPGGQDQKLESEFNYNPNSRLGPQNWRNIWKECGGILQSPININTSKVWYNRPYKIHYNLDNVNTKGDFLNNGHSCAFYPLQKLRVLYGVPYAEKDLFVLDQVHFHFGNDLQHGSEHGRDGLYVPVEAHLVHYNSKYGTAKNASMYKDGSVAVAVFFEVGYGPPTDVDRFISEYVPRIIRPDTMGVRAEINLSSILPYKRDLYTYYGSKTTPPCTPNIRWIVMRVHKSITPASFRWLYMLANKQGQRISRYGNFRPVQDASCRLIEANFEKGMK